jgi:hypothetical protein
VEARRVSKSCEGEQEWRTEYEDESPCTVTDEEEYDGGAAPAIAEGNQELDESKDKKDSFE